ncbi:MAG: hypothetical protein FJZ87_16445, partial [Chloroflexi bacterium]|nr:hypothetical protein [Chloroflexota bacterium]
KKQRDRLEGLERDRRTALEKRTAEEAEHARLKTQLEVLDQAEQSLSGFADGARFLLDASRRSTLAGLHGVFSSSLDVPVELEVAIAAALGDTLDAILIEAGSLEGALNLLESDQASRAALLPLEETEPTTRLRSDDPDCLGNAVELIQYPSDKAPVVVRMLGATLIVRSRAGARRLIRRLPPHARVVTLRGEVFRGDGLILAGRTNAATSLGQPRRKREMESRLQAASTVLAESSRLVDELTGAHSLSHNELTQTESDLHEARIQLGELQEAEQQAGLEFESAVRHLDWQKAQLEQLEDEVRAAESSRHQWTDSLVELERTSDEARAHWKEITAKLAGISSDEFQGQVSYWATRLAVSEQSLSNALARKQELGSEISRLDERRVELASRLMETENALKGLDRDRTGFREKESGIHAQIESERAQILPAERDLESAEKEEKRLQDAEESAQRALANAERILGQAQLDQARKQSALDHLRQRVTDDFGLVMFDYAAEVSGPVPLPFEGMVEELPVVTELDPKVEEQLSHHRGQLRRMGPINPDAKREFEQEKERYEFMKSQVEDLHKAEADLKRVIAELDEITRQEFSRTFDLVDKQFRETFVRLFGGGSARLSLTDPDNLVETGIEIEARLPGRREQGLALLSGGERSLTAIALVFALLKVSPTPVCVMDEVDAMLDEANVGRFRDLLVDLSKDTQFIIITHNRNTVQAADVIYGITMGRDSTSQLISLRLDQVTDDMLKRA